MKLHMRLAGASIVSVLVFGAVPALASAVSESVQLKAGKIAGVVVEDGG